MPCLSNSLLTLEACCPAWHTASWQVIRSPPQDTCLGNRRSTLHTGKPFKAEVRVWGVCACVCERGGGECTQDLLGSFGCSFASLKGLEGSKISVMTQSRSLLTKWSAIPTLPVSLRRTITPNQNRSIRHRPQGETKGLGPKLPSETIHMY